MHLILCIDDNGGMAFNHRRQSRDRVVLADLLAMTAGHTLWMNSQSAKLFADTASISVDPQFLQRAGTGDWCFVEDQPITPVLDRIESLTLYHWNRVYPADLHLDLDPKALGWSLVQQTEFPGHSHEKITKECYRP
jgi:hypothetical protein